MSGKMHDVIVAQCRAGYCGSTRSKAKGLQLVSSRNERQNLLGFLAGEGQAVECHLGFSGSSCQGLTVQIPRIQWRLRRLSPHGSKPSIVSAKDGIGEDGDPLCLRCTVARVV